MSGLLGHIELLMGAGGSAPTDPDWASVVALMHFNGTDASTTMTDETGATWTANGTAQIDTAQSVFGGASLLLDGGGTVRNAHATRYNLAGDFTIEGRIRVPNFTKTNPCIMGSGTAAYGGSACFLTLRGTAASAPLQRRISLGGAGVSGTDAIVSATQLAIDTWYAFAIARVGTTMRLFLDGALDKTVTNSNVFNFSDNGLRVGGNGWDSTAGQIEGWIDELRITKGVGRYTSSYTPAASEFPNS